MDEPCPRTLQLDGGRSLHVAQAGAGPDLVLIHGALATHRDWLLELLPRLARQFRVTAVDRPGHGLSRRLRFEGSPREQARQIADGLEALGIERAAVVGHSFGGLVALALAEEFPSLAASLVLLAPLAFPEPRPLEHLLLAPRAFPVGGPALSGLASASLDPPLLEVVHRLMFAPQPVLPEWQANYPYDDILNAVTMVAEGEDAASILPLSPAALLDYAAITTPATIVTGTSDRIVNPALHARPLSVLLREARLVEVDGAGHMVHHAARDQVIQCICETAGLPQSSAR